MIRIQDIIEQMEYIAPLNLAASWDNVGLILGDGKKSVAHVMTCLTITPGVIKEAVSKHVGLIVSHHPFPYREYKRIGTENWDERMLHELLRNDIAVYSSHTAYDGSKQGINEQIAGKLGLSDIMPLDCEQIGAPGLGRWGNLPETQSLAELTSLVARVFQVNLVKVIGQSDTKIQRIAIGCGSASSLLKMAQEKNCDLFITGEMTFHQCIDALGNKLNVMLVGHYASEKFAMGWLAKTIAKKLPQIKCWDSIFETNPVKIEILEPG